MSQRKRDEIMKNPPYASIFRLLEYVLPHAEKDYNHGDRDHIWHCAMKVQTWLDALEMTPWAQEQWDRLDES